MKNLLLPLYLLFSFSVLGQIINDNQFFYRYVDNAISVDNRFILDTVELDKTCDFRLLSKSDYYTKYFVKPKTNERSISLNLIPIKKNEEVREIKFYIISPNPMYLHTVYPSKNDTFNITRSLKQIRLELNPPPDKNYYAFLFPTNYTVEFSNGKVYPNTTLPDVAEKIYVQRPSHIIIKDIRSKTDDFEYNTQDSVIINLSYPKSTDTSEWCFDYKKHIVQIDETHFSKEPDTLIIKDSQCLFLDLDASGTQNGFLITSLNGEYKVSYNDDFGRSSYLVDMSGRTGLYMVTLLGDGGIGNLILKINN